MKQTLLSILRSLNAFKKRKEKKVLFQSAQNDVRVDKISGQVRGYQSH